MTIKLITAPTFEPVTLAEAKAHCRIDTSDDNALVERLIKTARQHLEGNYGWLNRALVTQTFELYLDRFPGNAIKVPMPPLQSIVSVKYDDADGNEQTVAAGDYDVDSVSEPGWVVPKRTFAWPSTYDAINAVRVRFTAGWPENGASPSVAQTPEPIKQAILLMVADMYEMRETFVTGTIATAVPVSPTADRLLWPYWIASF